MTCRIIRATAIGDAYGAGFEYVRQDVVQNFNLGWGFWQHPKHAEIEPGMWTDDTMLSVAAARALLLDAERRCNPAQATLVWEMIELHRNHPTSGYSKHMLAALDAGAAGEHIDFVQYFVDTYRSDSNGAAMRSAIYGFFGDDIEVVESAKICARITHEGIGVEAAGAVAAASYFFVRGIGLKKDLNAFLAKKVGEIWTLRQRERVAKQNGPISLLTVTAALTAIRESETLSEVLTRCIQIGGDVDTVAAIAMGIAVSCEEIKDDLPESLWRGEGLKPVAGLTWDDLTALDEKLGALIKPGNQAATVTFA